MSWIRPTLWLLTATSMMLGCGSDSNDTIATNPLDSGVVSEPTRPSVTPRDDGPLDGVTGELIITRQRDLIGRGLINVLTTNESGEQLLISDRELVADHFSGAAAPARIVSVPDGRVIAIQVPYGVADECASDDPVTASLAFTYTTPTDDTARSTTLPLRGTDILDDIRADQCAGQALDAQTDMSFENVSIVDGTVRTDLVLERTDGTEDFTFGQPIGTVLVSVRTSDDSPAGSLAPTADSVTIPLVFVVNRCDPHALAEVTKRFGLDLEVSVDGAEPRPVTIPLTPLLDNLEAIVQQCFDAAG